MLNPIKWFKNAPQLKTTPKQKASYFGPVAVDAVLDSLFAMGDPDEVLRKLGIRRQDLRIMETDDEITAAMDTRQEAVISTSWRLEPGTGRAVTRLWDEMEPHIIDLMRGAMKALSYGYSVQEIIYTKKNGFIGIDRTTRVMDVVGYIESGRVFIPEEADYISEFIHECEAFTPNGAHSHDDQIDPMVDAINDLIVKQSSVNAPIIGGKRIMANV